MWTTYFFLVSVIAAFSLTLFAAYSDYKLFIIPNWISIALCILYPIAVLTSPVEIDWFWSLVICGIVFVVGFTLYILGGLGGGDVKLLSALCLWAGLTSLPLFLLATVIAGGFLVPVILYREIKKMPEDSGSIRRKIKTALRARLQIPYGVAIAIGSTLIFIEYANYANLFG